MKNPVPDPKTKAEPQTESMCSTPASDGMDVTHYAAVRHSCKAFDPNKTIPEATAHQLEELLRLAPSSINAQPWHYIMATTPSGKNQVAQSMPDTMSYNAQKVRAASHVLVLCGLDTLSDAHIAAMVEQEAADGRYQQPQDKTQRLTLCHGYVGKKREAGNVQPWIDRQVYLALGTLLLGAATLGIDACPIEGFDTQRLDNALGLGQRGMHSLVVVAMGYRSPDDFNAVLPKSRFPAQRIFTRI